MSLSAQLIAFDDCSNVNFLSLSIYFIVILILLVFASAATAAVAVAFDIFHSFCCPFILNLLIFAYLPIIVLVRDMNKGIYRIRIPEEQKEIPFHSPFGRLLAELMYMTSKLLIKISSE